MKKNAVLKTILSTACVVFLSFYGQEALATNAPTIGGMASMITQSFANLAKLITAGSYLAGIGFAIGAILKFKQHKDNPTQITIGQPIALTFIAAALLFLPSILAVTGSTMFGAGNAIMAGPGGIDLTTGK